MVVMLLHLMVGLGLLWPVLVVAAWGSGVALTPTEKPTTRSETPEKLAPPARDALDPQVLTTYLSAEFQWLRQAEPPENLRQTMQSLRDCLERILWGMGTSGRLSGAPGDHRGHPLGGSPQ